MFSSEELKSLMEKIKAQIGHDASPSKSNTAKSNKNNCPGKKGNTKIPPLTPQKVLVILGLLTGALEVKSVTVDKDQIVDILLEGTLKRKTKLDKMLDEIGSMSFDDVLKAIIGRVS
jgi:hypothetical protein